MLFAKVRPHDVGVSDHRLGIAVGDLAPGDENGDAFGEFHDGAHHVLDHDDGDALRLQPEDEREDVVDLGGRKPGHGLIRDEELGLRGDGACELELPHVHLREPSGGGFRLSGEAHLLEDAHRLFGHLALRQAFSPVARGVDKRDAQVVEHRHADERLGDLEAARKAEAYAAVRRLRADVAPLEADDALARSHHEIDAVESREAAKPLRDTGDDEKRFTHLERSPLRRQASTQPMMPFGASVTNSTSSTPTMSRFQAEETVTCTICWMLPSSTAPMSGPIQLIMPPMSGMAMLLTAYERLNAELGSTYER